MKPTLKKVGKSTLPTVDKHSHINDPKLSDSPGWRDCCMAGERRRQEAAGVTAGRVRWSA